MTNETTPPKQEAEKPKGFFTKIVEKIDTKLKAKADEQAKNSCCCSSDSKDNDKCC